MSGTYPCCLPACLQGGKFDLAQDLCQKCLKYNKSCSKAWEFLGAIMEREQAYKDAAGHYEQAWKQENQASAQVRGARHGGTGVGGQPWWRR